MADTKNTGSYRFAIALFAASTLLTTTMCVADPLAESVAIISIDGNPEALFELEHKIINKVILRINPRDIVEVKDAFF